MSLRSWINENRILQNITENYTADDPVWVEYPIDFFGVKSYEYIQLKDNKYARFIKGTYSGETEIEKVMEGTYEVKDDKIIFDPEEAPVEYSFTISGKRIMLVSGDEAIEATKVSDSEVAGAK